MKKFLAVAVLAAMATCSCSKGTAVGPLSGPECDHVAYPVGGFGSGMFCVEGSGAISNLSLWHAPDLFNEPFTFAAVSVKGLEDGTRVLESPVPDHKKFGARGSGKGSVNTTWGLPRYARGTFSARFPFATVALSDRTMPLDVEMTVWNPFIPSDEDNSSLPLAEFAYTFTNSSSRPVEAVFSFNTKNFMARTKGAPAEIRKMRNGFVLCQLPLEDKPWSEGYCAFYTDCDSTVVDCCWFRGGWFDSQSMAWNKASCGAPASVEPAPGAPGASLYVPLRLAAGESRTVRMNMVWYVPKSGYRFGYDAKLPSDYGDRYDPALYADLPQFYEPWYSHRFPSLDALMGYWDGNRDSLRERTAAFTEALYDTTLPPEVMDAVTSNLTVLKSTTTMRQHDGRPHLWEGSGDSEGCCRGSTTHVWNYAQATAHLFPALERSLREIEFLVDQASDGHQVYRCNLPVRPADHSFHAACDGQLGGIIKAYREWRISGDTGWMRGLYPQIRQSMDFCISTWDPSRRGVIEEPHHNTYDIEFWGPDPMCTGIYATALNAFISLSIGAGVGEDGIAPYRELLAKAVSAMENSLWNGEYFSQKVVWEGLRAPDPTMVQSFQTSYSDEARAILAQEGPKYQYGSGCLSDGAIGGWMGLVCGLDEVVDREKVAGHLDAVHRYNLIGDLSLHANPQRPGYALGHDGGLVLCTWPHGGRPNLPFIYSDEVWTGIEYQVAAHLIFEEETGKGLDIVRTARARYHDGTRNPFNEYEYGSWYGRALSSYSLLQALTGVRYDAVERTLHIDSRIGDFRSFFAFDGGYATVGLKHGKPFLIVRSGTLPVDRCVVGGEEVGLE